MASTPRNRGADVKLYGKTESAFGTAPSGDWAQLPFFSFEHGASAELQDDPALSATAEITRDATGVYIGRSSISGQAIVPVDLENFGFWLRALLGAPTTTGSGDYTHTWVSGATGGLPSVGLEKALSRLTKYGLMTGNKANTLALTAGTEQKPRATIGLMAQDEAFSGSSAAGTPTWAGMTQFHQKQYSVTDNGSALGNCIEFTLNYGNGMEPYFDLNSGDAPTAIDEGLASCDGSFRTRVSADTMSLIDDAIAETGHALVLKLQISSTKLLQFTISDALLSRPTIGITGPGGTEVTFNWRARYSASAGEMLEVILKNQISAYS